MIPQPKMGAEAYAIRERATGAAAARTSFDLQRLLAAN